MTASPVCAPPALKPVRDPQEHLPGPRDALVRIGHQLTFLIKSLGAVPSPSAGTMPVRFGACWPTSRGSRNGIVVGAAPSASWSSRRRWAVRPSASRATALHLLGMDPPSAPSRRLQRRADRATPATGIHRPGGCSSPPSSDRCAGDRRSNVAIRPMPHLVTTRMIAAVLSIVPLYAIALSANYLAAQFMFQIQSGRGDGTYLYYFQQFLLSWDMVLSFLQGCRVRPARLSSSAITATSPAAVLRRRRGRRPRHPLCHHRHRVREPRHDPGVLGHAVRNQDLG